MVNFEEQFPNSTRTFVLQDQQQLLEGTKTLPSDLNKAIDFSNEPPMAGVYSGNFVRLVTNISASDARVYFIKSVADSYLVPSGTERSRHSRETLLRTPV